MAKMKSIKKITLKIWEYCKTKYMAKIKAGFKNKTKILKTIWIIKRSRSCLY